MVVVYASHRPLLDSRVVGRGTIGRRGHCWTSERWWRILLPVLLVAGLGANFLVASMGQGNAWFVSLARLRHDPAWIDPWHEYFNTHLTAGRLLTVGDAAVFDLSVPVLYNTCFDDCIFEQLVRGKTAAQVRAELAARQITYVYVNWGEIARYRSPGNYGFTDFVQPEVFDRLVAQGVLEPLPSIEGHPGRGYRVKWGVSCALTPNDRWAVQAAYPLQQQHVGPNENDGIIVPTGQLIRPAGQTLAFGGRPVDIGLSPDQHVPVRQEYRELDGARCHPVAGDSRLGLPRGRSRFDARSGRQQGRRRRLCDRFL